MGKMNRNLFIALLGVVFGMTIVVGFIFGVPRIQLLMVSMLLPLVGAILRPGKSAGCVGLFFGAKWFLFGILPVTFGVPTACAAANWSLHAQQGRRAQFMRFCLNVLLPIVCIVLFVLHPVGSGAFVYSLYWLIPITVFFIRFFFKHSAFLVALSSTFLAHAVGSVMWLYLVPVPPERWIALIPVVAVERLCIAAGGYLMYLMAGYLVSRFFSVNIRAVECKK